MNPHAYRGRFAPSPTGPLHAGSLVAALASWLDARAHRGTWLVRIEDIDPPRCQIGADLVILQQLAQCGLLPDEPPVWQSQRHHFYQRALDSLLANQLAYPCGCTRKDIETVWQAKGWMHERHIERPYPGTCQNGLNGKQARSWRFALTAFLDATPTECNSFEHTAYFLTSSGQLTWNDRRLGQQMQLPAQVAGDFNLIRADGLYSYQLAVVVDDGLQDITHIVRGEDLTDNTPRQLLLQRALGLRHPCYMHMPLVRLSNGEKLSKQHGAPAVDVSRPIEALNTAALSLHLQPVRPETSLPDALAQWVCQWQATYNVNVTEHQSNPMADTNTAPSTQPSTGQAPADVAFPKTIRSYVRRTGRVTTGQAKAFEDLGPKFLLPYANAPLDARAAFGREGKLILEIGFGMGEATAHIARVRPEDNFLCCEVHEPGVGALLKRIGEQDIHNIRILQHDAVEVIDNMLLQGFLDGIHIFFPDPWHKKKHNKRRLIQSPLVAKLADRLKTGGYIHCATDWEPYAIQMLEVLNAEPQLRNTDTGYAKKPDYRPLTKFENRGLRLGHGVWDLVFTKR